MTCFETYYLNLWYKEHKTNQCTCKLDLNIHIRNHQFPKLQGKFNINKNRLASLRATTAAKQLGNTAHYTG